MGAVASQVFLGPLVPFAGLLPPPGPDLGSPQKSLPGTPPFFLCFEASPLPSLWSSTLLRSGTPPPCLKFTFSKPGSDVTSYPHLLTFALISTVVRGETASDRPRCPAPALPHSTPLPLPGFPSSEPPTRDSTKLLHEAGPPPFPSSMPSSTSPLSPNSPGVLTRPPSPCIWHLKQELF